jgi:hypothetical protein
VPPTAVTLPKSAGKAAAVNPKSPVETAMTALYVVDYTNDDGPGFVTPVRTCVQR